MTHSPASEQVFQVVVLHAPEHPQLDVGQRAHGERNALFCQPFDQGVILHTAHAVVDAFHLEQVQRFVDVFGRALLAGMRRRAQAFGAGAREHALELRRRMAALGGIQADRGEIPACRAGLVAAFANA